MYWADKPSVEKSHRCGCSDGFFIGKPTSKTNNNNR